MSKQSKDKTLINGERLAMLRKKRGLSQRALADKSTVSKRTIENYESKKTASCQPTSVKLLADTLGVSLETLLVNTFNGTESSITLVRKVESPEHITSQENTEVFQTLHLTCYADPTLQYACEGLLLANGSDNCVTNAIAHISAYLYHVVAKIPELKEHSHLIVDSSLSALSSAILEDNCVLNTLKWSGFKNSMSELAYLTTLPNYARKEAIDIIHTINEARTNVDVELMLKAVKASVYWLNDNWHFVSHNTNSYNVFRYVSDMLKNAPADFNTKKKIITGVNSFVSFIKVYDTNGIFIK